MREILSVAFKSAMKAQDKRRMATLRLVQAAIHDRDIANRGTGKDPISDDDIVAVLSKMIKQREESVTVYESGNRPELAQQEREEIAIIREFLPEQLCEDAVRSACEKIVTDVNAGGLRDMGKCMAALKEKYAGQMDFTQASGIVKRLLQ
ncbi:MAG: GatB/YqeY domain-containing protein [Phyllobacteriaceae bacterium]|nr:GatB/YqeY domain-containing protein [Phyllobacteriaceae bacterium]